MPRSVHALKSHGEIAKLSGSGYRHFKWKQPSWLFQGIH